MDGAFPFLWIPAVVALSGSTAWAAAPQESATPPFKNPALDIDQRVADLLARMTLPEKVGQMSQASATRSPLDDATKEEIRDGRWGSFLNVATAEDRAEAQRVATRESRLGIPLIFGRDVIHGYRTLFPIPLGQAASWDPELVQRAARVAAQEAAADGIHWTFAPMLDIARDPRWGRIAESLGEDPTLASALGAAMVRGFQGRSLAAPDSIAACAKHFVGYGAAEGGRDYDTTWIPEVLLRNVYLRPFRAARDAGAATVMSAFNDLNGIPASGNAFTLRQILRGEWGFDGFVVSDWDAVKEMIAHGYASGTADAALKGVRAGVDMEMSSTTYHDHLPSLVESGELDPRLIDESVRNILRIKYRRGLFDQPQRMPSAEPLSPTPEALEAAQAAATESIVLLKNDGGVLPLSRSLRRIAVVGPLADSPTDQMGTWALDGRREDVRTPLAALRQALGAPRVAWAPGLRSARDTSHDGFAAALEAARGADAVLLFLGEDQALSGEARSRAFLDLPGAQEPLVGEVAKAGRPMIAIILAGRPLTFHAVAQEVSGILFAWHPGTMGGPALASLVLGDAVPSGKLPVTFPRTVGQIPLYYAHMNTGRPPPATGPEIPMGTPVDPEGFTSRYLDVESTPEYPFGFGLSYARFDYSDLRLSRSRLRPGEPLVVSAEVANVGTREAEEIVQLYTRALAGSVTRPVRELRAFRRVRLKPGERRAVAFTLGAGDLAYWGGRGRWATEPGAFQVWVAPDSASGLRGQFEVR